MKLIDWLLWLFEALTGRCVNGRKVRDVAEERYKPLTG